MKLKDSKKDEKFCVPATALMASTLTVSAHTDLVPTDPNSQNKPAWVKDMGPNGPQSIWVGDSINNATPYTVVY